MTTNASLIKGGLFPIALVKTKSDVIVRSVLTGSGR